MGLAPAAAHDPPQVGDPRGSRRGHHQRARDGMVPGAVYRHVRSKEQLLDLVLDGVLAEADTRADPALSWTVQIRSGRA
jgi:hypothetical protein